MGEMRIPPHSDEAERAVLGSLLLDPIACVGKCVSLGLRSNHFYDSRNQYLFGSIMDMHSGGVVMDAVTIGEWLKENHELDRVGGYDYLIHLQEETFVPAHLNHYAEIVLEKSRCRAIIDKANIVTDMAYSGEDSFKIAQEMGVSLHAQKEDIFEIAREAEELDRKIARGERVGIPFPWHSLQQKTYGIPKKAVTPLAGRDGCKKSRLVTYMANHWLQMGISGLYFPFEDSKHRFMSNLAASYGQYDMFTIRSGHTSDAFLDRHAECLARVADYPLEINEEDTSIDDVETAILKSDAEWVVIDGLKDVFSTGGENQTARDNDISAVLNRVARRKDVAIITISHLTKIEDGTWINRFSIRGSGNQNTSGRMVMLLQDAGFPAGMTEKYGDMSENIILQVPKASYGHTGIVVLKPELEHGRFVEVEEVV